MNAKHGLSLDSGEFIPAEELNRKPQSKQIDALKLALAGLVKATRYGFGEFEEEKSAISSAIQHLEMAEQPAQHSASVLEQNTSNSLETTNQEAQDEAVAIADGTFNHNCPIGTPLYTSPQPAQQDSGLTNGYTDPKPAPVQQEPVAWLCCVPGQDAVLLFDEPRDEQYPPGYKEPLGRLSQPAQQKPEAVYQCLSAGGYWIDQTKDSYDYNVRHGHATVRVLYTSPPASKPLTDEQIEEIAARTLFPVNFARAIEAAHGITGEK